MAVGMNSYQKPKVPGKYGIAKFDSWDAISTSKTGRELAKDIRHSGQNFRLTVAGKEYGIYAYKQKDGKETWQIKAKLSFFQRIANFFRVNGLFIQESEKGRNELITQMDRVLLSDALNLNLPGDQPEARRCANKVLLGIATPEEAAKIMNTVLEFLNKFSKNSVISEDMCSFLRNFKSKVRDLLVRNELRTEFDKKIFRKDIFRKDIFESSDGNINGNIQKNFLDIICPLKENVNPSLVDPINLKSPYSLENIVDSDKAYQLLNSRIDDRLFKQLNKFRKELCGSKIVLSDNLLKTGCIEPAALYVQDLFFEGNNNKAHTDYKIDKKHYHVDERLNPISRKLYHRVIQNDWDKQQKILFHQTRIILHQNVNALRIKLISALGNDDIQQNKDIDNFIEKIQNNPKFTEYCFNLALKTIDQKVGLDTKSVFNMILKIENISRKTGIFDFDEKFNLNEARDFDAALRCVRTVVDGKATEEESVKIMMTVLDTLDKFAANKSILSIEDCKILSFFSKKIMMQLYGSTKLNFKEFFNERKDIWKVSCENIDNVTANDFIRKLFVSIKEQKIENSVFFSLGQKIKNILISSDEKELLKNDRISNFNSVIENIKSVKKNSYNPWSFKIDPPKIDESEIDLSRGDIFDISIEEFLKNSPFCINEINYLDILKDISKKMHTFIAYRHVFTDNNFASGCLNQYLNGKDIINISATSGQDIFLNGDKEQFKIPSFTTADQGSYHIDPRCSLHDYETGTQIINKIIKREWNDQQIMLFHSARNFFWSSMTPFTLIRAELMVSAGFIGNTAEEWKFINKCEANAMLCTNISDVIKSSPYFLISCFRDACQATAINLTVKEKEDVLDIFMKVEYRGDDNRVNKN